MAALPAAARRDIEAFCAQLLRRGIKPQRVILFGSYACGRQHEGSDIDLIVVSADFRGKGFLRRLELLGGASGDALVPVQALGYTPEEFAAPEPASFLAIALSQRTVDVLILRVSFRDGVLVVALEQLRMASLRLACCCRTDAALLTATTVAGSAGGSPAGGVARRRPASSKISRPIIAASRGMICQ